LTISTEFIEEWILYYIESIFESRIGWFNVLYISQVSLC
jgi:hypothetical protein